MTIPDVGTKEFYEGVKLAAEARYYDALADRQVMEGRKAEAEAAYAEIKTGAERRADNLLQASDANHLVYRFLGEINNESVTAAVYRLGCWSRLHPGKDIEIVFSSPGGSLIDGMALYDRILQLRADGHKVITGTLGQAASMAGVLLQAGDVRWMGSQAWLLIHKAGFGIVGKTYEVEDQLELVKRFEDRIIDIFIDRSTLTSAKIKKNWNRKDWWSNSDQCLEFGLVDEIRGSGPVSLPEKDTLQLTLDI